MGDVMVSVYDRHSYADVPDGMLLKRFDVKLKDRCWGIDALYDVNADSGYLDGQYMSALKSILSSQGVDVPKEKFEKLEDFSGTPVVYYLDFH
jgi:hypothetical protein